MFEVFIAELEGLVGRLNGVVPGEDGVRGGGGVAPESSRGCGIPADADAIIRVRRAIDALSAGLAAAEVAFDLGEGWLERGSGSLRSWLADEGGLSRGEASSVARRADRLGVWPEVAAAWVDGRLSGAQVDHLCAAVPARFASRFADDAAVVVDAISPLDVTRTAAVLRGWVRMAEAEDTESAFRERSSGLHLSSTLDGRSLFSADLDSVAGAIVGVALRDFDVADAVDETGAVVGGRRTLAQRRADALVALAKFGIAHRDGAGDSGRFLPHVSLIVDVPELMAASLRGAGITTPEEFESFSTTRDLGAIERAWFADALSRQGTSTSFDGVEFGPVATSLFTCDAVVNRILTAGSRVIDMGREVRTAPPHLRRAVISRDRHCRAPGCTREARFCDVHHVDHWIDDGETNCDRLVLLCSFHHHLFHRPGWSMELDADAVLTLHFPDGRTRHSRPPDHGPPQEWSRDRARDGAVMVP